LITHLEKSQNPRREYVVLLWAQDLESLEATIELLSDAAALERLKQADAAVAAGGVNDTMELGRPMAERRRRGPRAD